MQLALDGFIWASLGWGLLNWIPIRPLDGGAILTSFLEIVIPKRAFAVAKVVSAIAGAAAAFFLWRMGSIFGVVFILLITLTGLRSDPAERSHPQPAPQPGGVVLPTPAPSPRLLPATSPPPARGRGWRRPGSATTPVPDLRVPTPDPGWDGRVRCPPRRARR